MNPACVPSRHLYQVLVERRDEVMFGLNQQGIYPGVHYRDNIHYSMYSYAEGTCPKARHASDHVISLPIHLRMQYKDVKRVAEALKDVVRMQAKTR
ncbi:MAG: DegT/DnrJ/EryC1/StrS family aminotransferase, partial [Anaerolinea sp.]|nr:DegT/DnrJ/EryC1/StrS family aminotransferase [Anaerolinea sp.]